MKREYECEDCLKTFEFEAVAYSHAYAFGHEITPQHERMGGR